MPENTPQHSIFIVIVTSILSALFAVFIIIGFVLPANYNIDPTGIGKKLGILGAYVNTANQPDNNPAVAQSNSANQANTPAAPVATVPTDISSLPLEEHEDTVELVVPPKQSLTYRLSMERDYALKYTWLTDGQPLASDFRGERKDAKTNEFKSFSKKESAKLSSFFIVPFDGNFGWHWENKSEKAVTIKLHIKGAYKILGIGKEVK